MRELTESGLPAALTDGGTEKLPEQLQHHDVKHNELQIESSIPFQFLVEMGQHFYPEKSLRNLDFKGGFPDNCVRCRASAAIYCFSYSK